MKSLPWIKLWFDDLDRDCGALSLAARGAWVWIIGDLHSKTGERSLNLTGWSRVIRANINQTATVLAELINTKTCDSSVTQNVTRDALIQKSDAEITIICRRTKREYNSRQHHNIRQRRYRTKHNSDASNDASVTPIEAIEAIEAREAEALNTNARSDSKSESSEPPFILLPLSDKSEYPITRTGLAELSNLYPGVDPEQEILRAKGWLIANPTRRKTKRGIARFLHNWMSRAQDKPHPGGNGNLNYGSTPAVNRELAAKSTYQQLVDEQNGRK